MTSLLQDLRYALRVLLKHRAFALAALATMAVAIAANTAIFTLVNGILLTPLRLPQADRIVRVEERHGHGRLNLTGATFADLHERARTFKAVAAYRIMSPGLSTGSGPEQVTAAEVSSGYFAVLGVAPAAGRWLTAPDGAAGSGAAMVIGDGLWRRTFGAASSALGRRVLLNGVPTEIVGIAPAGMFAPGAPDIWIPQSGASPLLRNRRAHLFTTIARIADGITVDAAGHELATLAGAIERDSGAIDPAMTLTATPLQARMVEGVRPALLVLWTAVGLVLLIAAANIANLLLMQGAARARELSIRSALGAARSRIARQLATESLVIGAAGGAAGTLLGLWSIPALRAALPASVPRASELTADARVVAFGISVSLLMAILFGLAPALRNSIRRPIDALRGRTDDSAARSPVRSALVITEVALTVMLLAGAGLLGRSLVSVLQIDPGFDTAHVVTFRLSLAQSSYGDAAAHERFYAGVLDRVAALPGVEAAGVTGALPLSGTPATTMEPEGSSARDQLSADVITASPGFFSALRIPLKRGRLIAASDTRGAQPVVVINEAAMRRFWPDGADPLGRRVVMKDWGQPYAAQVVGVVGDVHQAGPDADVAPAAYYPMSQFPETTLSESIVVRTANDVGGTIAAVRAQVASVDRDQPIATVRTMDDVLAASVAERRFNVVVLASFALAAVLLAAVGIYGIVAFAIGQRTREIGVRIALGARPADVIRLTIAHGAAPVALGLAAGLAGALAASRVLEGLLFGVRPTDAATLGGVVMAIACVAALACAGPVRRAMRVDPVVALRGE